jgi:hypothetical protein
MSTESIPEAKCGVALDFIDYPLLDHELEVCTNKPFMFINSECWEPEGNTEHILSICKKTSVPVYFLCVSGAGHFNLTDLPSISPIMQKVLIRLGSKKGSRLRMGLGGISLHDVTKITSQCIVQFFRHHLNNGQQPLSSKVLSCDTRVTCTFAK